MKCYSFRGFIFTIFFLCCVLLSFIPLVQAQDVSDTIRATEQKRLRALVDGNIDVANELHADDFQLINPFGEAVTKEQYLGALASKKFKYLVWEPEKINVRVYGSVAIIRYRSRMEIWYKEQKISQQGWHTDFYEKRDGQWQVVWSQMTRIQ